MGCPSMCTSCSISLVTTVHRPRGSNQFLRCRHHTALIPLTLLTCVKNFSQTEQTLQLSLLALLACQNVCAGAPPPMLEASLPLHQGSNNPGAYCMCSTVLQALPTSAMSTATFNNQIHLMSNTVVCVTRIFSSKLSCILVLTCWSCSQGHSCHRCHDGLAAQANSIAHRSCRGVPAGRQGSTELWIPLAFKAWDGRAVTRVRHYSLTYWRAACGYDLS